MPETTAAEELAADNNRAVKVEVRVEVIATTGENARTGTIDRSTCEEGDGDTDTGSKSGGLGIIQSGDVKAFQDAESGGVGVGADVVVKTNEEPEADKDTGSKSGDRGIRKGK